MSIKRQYFVNTRDSNYTSYGAIVTGQTFTPEITHKLSFVNLKLENGGYVKNFTVEIWLCGGDHKPTGEVLTSTQMPQVGLPGSSKWIGVPFTPITVEADKEYAILIKYPDGGGSGDEVLWDLKYTGDYYERGHPIRSWDNGDTWTVYNNRTLFFQEWGPDSDQVRYEYCFMYPYEETYPSGAGWVAQTFTPSVSHYITQIDLYIYKVGSPPPLEIEIFMADDDHKPTGDVVASGSLVEASISEDDKPAFVGIPLTGGLLIADREYIAVVKCPGATLWTDYYNLFRYNYGSIYAGGVFLTSSNSGGSWVVKTSEDAPFMEFGEVYVPAAAPIPPPGEINSDAFSGYHCFIEQYQKRRIAGLLPFMLPDGSLFAE